MDFLVNNNKYIIGISMLLVNFGSRYIIQDLSLMQNKVLSHQVTKIIIMVAIFFVPTRDIIKSVILTFIVYILLYYLFDENKDFNLWHSSLVNNKICKKIIYAKHFNGQ